MVHGRLSKVRESSLANDKIFQKILVCSWKFFPYLEYSIELEIFPKSLTLFQIVLEYSKHQQCQSWSRTPRMSNINSDCSKLFYSIWNCYVRPILTCIWQLIIISQRDSWYSFGNYPLLPIYIFCSFQKKIQYLFLISFHDILIISLLC